jgi:hypothetical protein
MAALGRLLLRFMLVPLGYLVAMVVGSLVLLLGSWKLGQTADDADVRDQAVFGFVFAPIVLATLTVMWLPSVIGILISEAFAIRSWIFHLCSGAVCAWVGWDRLGYLNDYVGATQIPLAEVIMVVAAGLVWGLVYWAIAGSSAGFWKPVFVRPEGAPPVSPPPQIR